MQRGVLGRHLNARRHQGAQLQAPVVVEPAGRRTRPRPRRRGSRVFSGLWIISVLSLVMAGLWISKADARPPAATSASATITVPSTVPAPPTTTTTAPPTTTTTVPPPPPTTTTTAPPPPPTTTAPPAATLAARGQATAWGCDAALAYLRAYADPSFELVCPGDAQGHQAVTCISEAPCAPGQRMIGIADPCPAAYMNEAHNSWVLDNEVSGIAIPDGSTVIDPYGYCH